MHKDHGSITASRRPVEVRQIDKRVSEFVSALKQCSKTRDLEGGKKLHAEAMTIGCHTDKYVAAVLIKMYSRCRCIQLAREVFDGMVHRDLVTWNSLILGYVENGEYSVAMYLFTSMYLEPDSFTYVSVLKACVGSASERDSDKQRWLGEGIAIHRELEERGFHRNILVANTLIDMYCKCGSMTQAREVFDRMPRKDVVSWTCLLLGYVDNEDSAQAMKVFIGMDCEPDSFTYLGALRACAGLAVRELNKESLLEKGKSIHRDLKERGFHTNIVVANTLLDMYSKCGSMSHAQAVFDGMVDKNVVTWSSLIVGYVENGEYSVSMELLASMDCEPDRVTYIAVFRACAALGSVSLETGIAIHRQMKDWEFDIVLANTLLDMYCKCGCMQRAQLVFDTVVRPNVVSWTCLMLGYVENGESSAAMDFFTRMDCKPNYITYIAALKACGEEVSLGRLIHAGACKLGLEQTETLVNALVDFYAKCGRMVTAEAVFNSVQSPSIVCWTSLIGGYSSLGNSCQVFGLADRIQEAGLQMDSVTNLCVLAACSHAGLVGEGRKYFESIHKPTLEHYSCVVDMLGRANMLEDALSVIESMPFGGNSVIWTSLLGACTKWKDLQVGKVAFDALVALGARDASVYVLMSDLYGSLHMDEERMALDSEISNINKNEFY